MAESVARLAVGLLGSIAIARQLGPGQYGLYNLAITPVCYLDVLIRSNRVVARLASEMYMLGQKPDSPSDA